MVTWPLCLPLPQQWAVEAAQPASGKEVGSHLTDELWLSLPQISGQLSPRLFRKLPPRVCVSLKSIVDEDFLYAG